MTFHPKPRARRVLSILAPLAFALAANGAVAQMRITEYMYQGANGEFIEFTNVGALPIDLTGWSFDDDSRLAGTFGLSGFGLVLPGESVILTEATAADFRTAWGLCAGVKILGGSSQGLGRNDEINLYDADNALVDRLTYGDQTFPGTIRTQNRSGWVSAAGLGANDAAAWTLASAADAENSFTSTGADIASPGRSTRATVVFDACAAAPAGFPTIAAAPTTTPYLKLDGVGHGKTSGVLGDPTDPASTLGIDFVVGDTATPAVDLIVTASSSDQSVVPDANLILSSAGTDRNLRITPAAPGRTIVTLTVTDGDGNASHFYVLHAVSAASSTPSSTRFPTGACDASTALGLDASHMLIANDEDQRIRLYRRDQSGLHLADFDFTGDLGLTDLSGGVAREVDIEASTRVGDRIYWLGSHSNAASGALRVNRYRLFATDVSGSGAASTLAYAGRYDGLRADLIAWDASNGHGLGAGALGLAASAADGVIPETADGSGFNLEALAMAPDGTTAYIGFRAPLQDTTNRDHALIVPVANFAGLIGAGGTSGEAAFGAPIRLDLGGRAVRALERADDGQYLILAGPTASAGGFALYAWDGHAGTPAQLLTTDLSFDVDGGSFEGIVGPLASLAPGANIQLVVDNGDSSWYGDGLCKDGGVPEQQKFRLETVQLGYDNGVDPAVQAQVPNPSGGGNGDGNGDGTPDAEQANVVSLPGTGANYVTLAAEAADNGGAILPIVEMQAIALPGDAPGDLDFPFGAFRFRVLNAPPGGTVNLAMYVPAAPVIAGYHKPDSNGVWQDIATSITQAGDKQRITFSLTDGGPFDADGLVNGQILDPGGPVAVAADAPSGGLTPVPLLSAPAIGLLAGLLGLAGLGGLRRRQP